MNQDVAAASNLALTRDVAAIDAAANALRQEVIRMIAPTGRGYVQQGLGTADIFATLFWSTLRLPSHDIPWVLRDHFLLSASHNSAVFYATLALRGLIDADLLSSYCQDGSVLEVNTSERVGPAVEATCGSLGQGLSVAVGMALAARFSKSDAAIFVLLGDGEVQEGQVWEAAFLAGSKRLANLCTIIDCNGMQVEGDITNVLNPEPLRDKWEAFGWVVHDIDGHDVAALLSTFTAARRESQRPTCILARTIPGKGVPEFEGVLSHILTLSPGAAKRAMEHLRQERSVSW